MTLGDFVVTRDLDSVECDLGVTLDVLAESMRTNPEPGGHQEGTVSLKKTE